MNAAERRVMEQALEAMLNFPDDISDAMFESITALKAALAQPQRPPVTKGLPRKLPEDNDHGDWDRIDALEASLREHMAEIHRLRAALAQQAVGETAYDQAADMAVLHGTKVREA